MDFYDRDILFIAKMRLWNSKHKLATRTLYYFLTGNKGVWKCLAK